MRLDKFKKKRYCIHVFFNSKLFASPGVHHAPPTRRAWCFHHSRQAKSAMISLGVDFQ